MKKYPFIILLCLIASNRVKAFSGYLRNYDPVFYEQKTKIDSLTVMFWNLENFFDWRVDSLSSSTSDKEFSSFGKKHWTRKKFYAKCNAVAKTLFWIEDEQGSVPDIIGVAEIENRFVLSRLLYSTSLHKLDYSLVHYDSPDPRGIDVALMYRKSRLKLLDSKPLHIQEFKTRDILLSTFTTESGDSIAVLVNHHPSKYGDGSSPKRAIAMNKLKAAVDSLYESGFKNIVAMGDFNDTPDNETFRIIESELRNMASSLASRGEGSIRYNGKWELIDMFFLSPGLAETSQMKVIHPPFLTVRDSAHGGEKPLRTYSGPRYIGGVSDHCPILIVIK